MNACVVYTIFKRWLENHVSSWIRADGDAKFIEILMSKIAHDKSQMENDLMKWTYIWQGVIKQPWNLLK